jgi:voltage-gated sodium channel
MANGVLYSRIPIEDHNDELRYRESRELQQPNCGQIIVEHSCFQLLLGCVIVANAVVIGMETDNADSKSLWHDLEDIFLFVFIVELALKLFAFNIGLFKSSNPDAGWNVFDFIIVAIGCVDRVLSRVSEDSGTATFFVLLMRTFRLLRILRILRVFRIMKQLYLLANSMLDSLQAIFWVSVVCMLILYILAIVITRLVGQPETSADELRPLDEFRIKSFGTVSTTMLTLFQLMALPDMALYSAIYNEIPWFAIFLVVFIIFGGFGIAAMLTGVVCEAMVAHQKKREDEQRSEADRARYLLAEEMRRMFKNLETDGRGLSRDQFDYSRFQVDQLCTSYGVRLRPQDFDALFELVDDGSGYVETEELLYAMLQLDCEVRPMTIMELRRLVVHGLRGVSKQVIDMDESMKKMDERVNIVNARTERMEELLQEVVSRVRLPQQSGGTPMKTTAGAK